MLMLRMLGGVALTREDGVEVDALLRQPKHVALLAYLAMPRPGAWHRRDTLLATLWPELDEGRARTALRSALHTLRRHVGPATVRNRGNEEVGVDPEVLDTDVGRMTDAAAAGQHADALAYYRGELLPALHIDDADDFERWLDGERRRLRALARQSASALARDRERAGDFSGAIDAAGRAVDLAPNDEGTVRALIAVLDRSGDRAQAFAVYERFRARLASELGTRPSAETLALVEAVRTRRAAGVAPADETPAESATADECAPPRVSTPTSATTSSDDPTPFAIISARPSSATVTPPAAAPVGARPSRRLYALAGVAAAGVVVVLAAIHTPSTGSHVTPGVPGGGPAVARLLVLPPENATGDTALAYLATGVADDAARQLARLGTMAVSSSARAPWPAATRLDVGTLGRRFGSTILLRVTLARVLGAAGDSLEMRPVLLDAASRTEHPLTPTRFTPRDARDVASAVAAEVVGAVFHVPEPRMPHPPAHAVEPESYRLTLAGWHYFFATFDLPGARARFQQAIDRDPLNARAWAGLTTSWAAALASDYAPAEEADANASAAGERALALDSLDGTAWADLALVRIARARRFAAGVPFLRRAITADPSNPDVYLVAAAVYRELHRWDEVRAYVRRARALDPLNPLYLDVAGSGELCADRPAAALLLADEGLRADSTQRSYWQHRIQALSRLGRYDEALATWRRAPADLLPTPVRAALAGARGAAGFWTVWRAQGRWNLAQLQAAGARGWASPELLAFATVQAGDTAAGWRALNAQVPERAWLLYRLSCQEQFDEVRDTPQYAALVARFGAMPER